MPKSLFLFRKEKRSRKRKRKEKKPQGKTMVKVFIEKENKTKNVKAQTMKELLQKLNINPEEVLTIKNNELVTLETKVTEKDSIKLLSVISGG